MDDREKLSARYNRSRDYSRLLAMPEFSRFLDEVRVRNATTIEALTHGQVASLTEHDSMVEIRYFNALVAEIESAAKLEPGLKNRLEALHVIT